MNADGSLEGTATFNPGSGANSFVRSMMLQPDGKILLGGDFTTYSGVSRPGLARLNANGSLDTLAIASISGSIVSMARQTDGKIFLGGSISLIAGQSRKGVARLNADATLDTSFNVGTGVSVGTVNSIAQTANGNLLVAGTLTSFNSVSCGGVAQLINSAPSASITVPDAGQIRWARTGTAPEISTATFDLSTDNGISWTPLGFSTFITGGWSMAGLNLPENGLVRTRGRISSGQGDSSAGIIEVISSFNLSASSLPTISQIADVTTDEDTPTAAIPFTVADAGTPLSELKVSATSSNTALIPLANIGLAGADSSRSITLTPAPNLSGTAIITVSVTDGFTTVSDTFTVTVNAVNDAPTISHIAAQSLPTRPW